VGGESGKTSFNVEKEEMSAGEVFNVRGGGKKGTRVWQKTLIGDEGGLKEKNDRVEGGKGAKKKPTGREQKGKFKTML